MACTHYHFTHNTVLRHPGLTPTHATPTEEGKIASELDRADGFIHLSDLTGPRVVAKLFFTTATDLELLELDSAMLGDAAWVVGNMGDAAPDAETLAKSPLTVHYLLPDGCVHVYGGDVSTAAVVREASCPLVDGEHQFPSWL